MRGISVATVTPALTLNFIDLRRTLGTAARDCRRLVGDWRKSGGVSTRDGYGLVLTVESIG